MVTVPATDFSGLDGHFPSDVLGHFVKNSSFREREYCVRSLAQVMYKKEKMKVWPGQENTVFDLFEAIISQLITPHGGFPVIDWELKKARVLMDVYLYCALQYDGDQEDKEASLAGPRAVSFLMVSQSGECPLYEPHVAFQKIIDHSLLTDYTKIEKFEKIITQFFGEGVAHLANSKDPATFFTEDLLGSISSVLSFLMNAKYFPKKVKTSLTVFKHEVLVSESRFASPFFEGYLWKKVVGQLVETEAASNRFC